VEAHEIHRCSPIADPSSNKRYSASLADKEVNRVRRRTCPVLAANRVINDRAARNVENRWATADDEFRATVWRFNEGGRKFTQTIFGAFLFAAYRRGAAANRPGDSRPKLAQTLKVYAQQTQLAPRPLPPATRSEEAQVYSVTQGTPQLVTRGFARMKEAREPRAIDATIGKVVFRRKRHATIAVVQNARSRATDGIAREFNRKPVVVSGGANRGPLIGSGIPIFAAAERLHAWRLCERRQD
jgi:hypothetical protein